MLKEASPSTTDSFLEKNLFDHPFIVTAMGSYLKFVDVLMLSTASKRLSTRSENLFELPSNNEEKDLFFTEQSPQKYPASAHTQRFRLFCRVIHPFYYSTSHLETKSTTPTPSS